MTLRMGDISNYSAPFVRFSSEEENSSVHAPPEVHAVQRSTVHGKPALRRRWQIYD